ncbi:hypothetical protein CERSUDRAFT_114035 [Gelatoporia subvermispora B]|uniref:Uncharacterized protein n=1 Tax=Ceriporiopsis subvermispora (strain B) TaxID=914234 RepID=M2RFX8_CERS8|nr:hypothetical protein CERSUDRAFT_114035 [Gelatoporia subvermispora B]
MGSSASPPACCTSTQCSGHGRVVRSLETISGDYPNEFDGRWTPFSSHRHRSPHRTAGTVPLEMPGSFVVLFLYCLDISSGVGRYWSTLSLCVLPSPEHPLWEVKTCFGS